MSTNLGVGIIATDPVRSNTRSRRVLIDRRALAKLIGDHACYLLGIDSSSKAVSVSVRIENETEGSPAYNVGHKAAVEIIENFDGVQP